MIEIYKSESIEDFKAIETLAVEIWNEHYVPIIGQSQVDYMLDKFQTVTAMQSQLIENYTYYVVKYRNQLVGYFSVVPKNDVLFISKMYVKNSERSKGLGKRCFQFITDRSRDLNLPNMSLTVNKYNTKSINAYLKMGFVQTGSVVTDIGNGYVMDDFVMQKAVNLF